LLIPYGDRRLFIDLGAERGTIGAERGSERIAVEISSFVADSPVRDLQEAVGQFVVYRALLSQVEPERSLFLGVPARVYDSVLSEPLGQLVAADVRLRLLVFDAHQQSDPMDQLDRYRAIVRHLIEEYATYKPAYDDIRTEAVVDQEHDHYEVMQVGWNGDRRVHGSIIHIDLRDGKVWIEHNGTDARLAEELVAAGIPRSDIVLGFQPVELRPLTSYGSG
jgi:hypothetical protein